MLQKNMRTSSESLPIFARKRNSLLCPKQKVVDSYILGEVLGEGSCGKVTEAFNSKTKQLCAMKIIKKRHLHQTPGGEEDVHREVEILASLQHPNCIRLIDHFEDEEKQRVYIVTEYLAGGSVQQLCERSPNKRLSMGQARSLFSQLLDALEYLHSNSIIHRDIKLDNMLLSEDGVLKLSDFGVAARLGELCNAGDRKCHGSPAFQPPEMLLCKGCGNGFSGEKIDIWDSGLALFMMCIGTFPFHGNNVVSLLANIKAAAYTIPSWVDPCLADLLRSILNTNPEKRFSLAQIRAHPWMTMKLKKEKSIPISITPSAFKKERSKMRVDCQCTIV